MWNTSGGWREVLYIMRKSDGSGTASGSTATTLTSGGSTTTTAATAATGSTGLCPAALHSAATAIRTGLYRRTHLDRGIYRHLLPVDASGDKPHPAHCLGVRRMQQEEQDEPFASLAGVDVDRCPYRWYHRLGRWFTLRRFHQ